MHWALKFYVDLPHDPPRITPACPFCDTKSNGLHATDQFAWAIVLGKASNGQCVALDPEKYHNGPENPITSSGLEVIHDISMVTYGLCQDPEIMKQRRLDAERDRGRGRQRMENPEPGESGVFIVN